MYRFALLRLTNVATKNKINYNVGVHINLNFINIFYSFIFIFSWRFSTCEPDQNEQWKIVPNIGKCFSYTIVFFGRRPPIRPPRKNEKKTNNYSTVIPRDQMHGPSLVNVIEKTCCYLPITSVGECLIGFVHRRLPPLRNIWRL